MARLRWSHLLAAALLLLAARTHAQQAVFTNLDFAQGAQRPTGWELSADSASTFRFQRDTRTFKQGPVSLRITNDGPSAQGIVKLMGTSVPRQSFLFSGYVKATGQWNLIAGVVATFDANWKTIDWEKNQANVTPSETWTHFSKEMTLDPNTRHIAINLQVKGVGTVWFDDLQITTRSMTLTGVGAGSYLYRFVSPNDASWPMIPMPTPKADGAVSLPLPGSFSTERAQLEVLDQKRALLAIIPIDLAQPVALTEAQFQYLPSVRIPVQRNGKPVMGVTVRLASPNAARTFHQERTLVAKDNGVARFRNIPMNVPLVVNVLASGHAPQMDTQTLKAPNAPDGYEWPPVRVDWPDARIVTPEAAAAAQAALPSGAVEGSDGVITPLLVALGICGALVIALSWLLVSRRGSATPGTETGPQPTFDVTAAPPQIAAKNPAARLPGDARARATQALAKNSDTPPPALSAQERGRLVGLTGLYAERSFPLAEPTIIIGRDADNGVALTEDGSTSRRHASIQVTNGQYSVVDHGSSNGTFLNGERLPAGTPQRLHSGDELEIGKTRFRFEVTSPVASGKNSTEE